MQIVLPAESHTSISLKVNSYCESDLHHTYQWSLSGQEMMQAGASRRLSVERCILLPGVLDTFARELCPVSMLIREDFPTLERPITANSGSLGFGHCSSLTLLLTYAAVFTRTCRDG